MTSCPNCGHLERKAANYCSYCGGPLFFIKNNFIIRRSKKSRKTLEILDADMNPLFHAKYKKSSKSRWNIPRWLLRGDQYLATDVKLWGLGGSFLGEINQEPLGFGSERKYRIYDAKDEFRGIAFEKSVLPTPYLKLTNSKNKIIASIEGFSKNFGREPGFDMMTPDNRDIIATCKALDENSYRMEILLPEIEPFLILSYAIIYLVKPRIR